jgi:hypothetical protein
VLVDAARFLHDTQVWLFGVARLTVLLRPVHGRSPVLVAITFLLHSAPVWLFGAPGRTLVHAASATTVASLDIVVWEVEPAVPRWLPQLNGIRSPHIRDRLGGRCNALIFTRN